MSGDDDDDYYTPTTPPTLTTKTKTRLIADLFPALGAVGAVGALAGAGAMVAKGLGLHDGEAALPVREHHIAAARGVFGQPLVLHAVRVPA
jgi:hypothetical protein